MWIINSSSIPWWDDRYLFDAISVYLAHLCISHLNNEETPFILFAFYKLKAFRADSLQTTHKLRSELLDTESARIIYDEIYGYKFACLVQNLHCLIGEKEFMISLSSYVTKNLLNTMSINRFVDHLKLRNFHDKSKLFEYYMDHEGFSKLEIV
jgi:aminopeptidase N